MVQQPLTIIMTSCDRWDLFTITLDSFFKLNSYPYVAFHVHNDSTQAIPNAVKERYADKNITWHEGTKRGLSAAWDYLVALAETEYFFNLEDDFEFNGNQFFIEDSIPLLETYGQVWIRHINDHNHPTHPSVNTYWRNISISGDWCGFSFNPSVRKKSKWLEWFPNGVSGRDEIELSRHIMQNFYFTYSAATLTRTACRHIGNGRHTKDFKI